MAPKCEILMKYTKNVNKDLQKQKKQNKYHC